MNKCIDCKLNKICKYKETMEKITEETNSVITFDCSYGSMESKDKKSNKPKQEHHNIIDWDKILHDKPCNDHCNECQCHKQSLKKDEVNTKTNQTKETKIKKVKDKDNKYIEVNNTKDLIDLLRALYN